MTKVQKILVMVATCLSVGYLSSNVTMTSVKTWFPLLVKPPLNPPNWIFAPVWSTLYVLMAIAAGLVWSKIDSSREEVKKALLFFWIQLGLNALWSLLFFGLKNPFLALLEIILLWLMIYETYHKFNKINTLSGKLLLPYLAWVSFAFYLNASIWYLNR
jgi:translocator protein